jgi:hypothetical protein
LALGELNAAPVQDGNGTGICKVARKVDAR